MPAKPSCRPSRLGRAMAALRDDLELALDRAAFARQIGIEPDDWQRDLLRSSADRVLLNCCRQSGKSAVSAILALHRSLYHPGSLVLCLDRKSTRLNSSHAN